MSTPVNSSKWPSPAHDSESMAIEAATTALGTDAADVEQPDQQLPDAIAITKATPYPDPATATATASAAATATATATASPLRRWGRSKPRQRHERSFRPSSSSPYKTELPTVPPLPTLSLSSLHPPISLLPWQDPFLVPKDRQASHSLFSQGDLKQHSHQQPVQPLSEPPKDQNPLFVESTFSADLLASPVVGSPGLLHVEQVSSRHFDRQFNPALENKNGGNKDTKDETIRPALSDVTPSSCAGLLAQNNLLPPSLKAGGETSNVTSAVAASTPIATSSSSALSWHQHQLQPQLPLPPPSAWPLHKRDINPSSTPNRTINSTTAATTATTAAVANSNDHYNSREDDLRRWIDSSSTIEVHSPSSQLSPWPFPEPTAQRHSDGYQDRLRPIQPPQSLFSPPSPKPPSPQPRELDTSYNARADTATDNGGGSGSSTFSDIALELGVDMDCDTTEVLDPAATGATSAAGDDTGSSFDWASAQRASDNVWAPMPASTAGAPARAITRSTTPPLLASLRQTAANIGGGSAIRRLYMGGPLHYRLSAEVALRCPNLVHSRPRMRRRKGGQEEDSNSRGDSRPPGSNGEPSEPGQPQHQHQQHQQHGGGSDSQDQRHRNGRRGHQWRREKREKNQLQRFLQQRYEMQQERSRQQALQQEQLQQLQLQLQQLRQEEEEEGLQGQPRRQVQLTPQSANETMTDSMPLDGAHGADGGATTHAY